MIKIYACLCGNWVDLCSDPNCKMGNDQTFPTVWWEENAPIYRPVKKN